MDDKDWEAVRTVNAERMGRLRDAIDAVTKERDAAIAQLDAIKRDPDPTESRLARAKGRTCPTCGAGPGAACELWPDGSRDNANSFGIHYTRFDGELIR